MKTKIINLFELRSGVFNKLSPHGDAYYLQSKDLDRSGEISLPRIKNLQLNRNLENHLLTPGDVLLVAKGSYNPAVTFSGSSVPVVASTTFLILRTKPLCLNKILPEYLTWFLNQPQTQKQLKSFAKGTAISSISISILANLIIDVPDAKTQKQILKIQELRNKENELKRAIDKLKEQLVQRQLLQAAKKN